MHPHRNAPPAPRLFNMAHYCLAAAARRTPGKPALIVIDDAASPVPAEVWSYRALQDAVLRIAAALRATGLAPGGRIVIRLDNTSDYALLFFGALAGGFVVVPTSSHLSAREAQFILEDSEAEMIALGDGLAIERLPAGVRALDEAQVTTLKDHPRAEPYAATLANDPAFLIYTSGTTARPKGVLHAHRSAWGRRPMYDGWYGIGPTDRMLHAGAFNWTYTLGTGLTDPWANGATAIVYTGPRDPAVWPRLIANREATLFAAVPGVFRQALKYAGQNAFAMPSLRHGLSAGEALMASVAAEWRQRAGTPLYEALGMSELSTFISSSPTIPARPGAVGRPQQGRRVAILPPTGGEEPLGVGEEGLLAAHRSDPGLMLGYWKRPEEEAAVFRGEWFCGGDLAWMDAEGYVTHSGRVDDVMNALGYRVSPLEVEQALAAHPDVADVAAAEIAARNDLSIIAAFVVAEPGQAPDIEALRSFAAGRLAAYKVPRRIIFVDGLPRTANGKIRRRELGRRFSAT